MFTFTVVYGQETSSRVGLASRGHATFPCLTRPHHTARLAFARDHVNWTLEQWKQVLLTDEAKVSLRDQDEHIQVYKSEE